MVSRKWIIAIPIMLVMLALCAGMVWLGFTAFRNLNSLGGLYIFNWRVQDTPAEAEESQSFQAADALVVNNACGDIRIAPGKGDQITLTLHKKAWGANEAEARANLEKIQLVTEEESGKLTVGLKNADRLCSGNNMRPPSIQIDLQVPEATQVLADTQFGNVRVEGLQARVELHSQFGDIEVRQVLGEVRASSGNGQVTIDEVQAGEAGMVVQSNFGSISVQQSQAGSLEVQAGNGQVTMDKVQVDGPASLSGDFGEQTWQGGSAQRLEVKNKNGRIALQDLQVSGEVTLESNFGDVTLRGVSAESYSVTTKNGQVTVEGATGAVTAKSDFGDVSVQADEPIAFNLTSQNGALSYRGPLGEGSSQARTRFGNVRLALPGGSAFDFDLQTNFGKISSDFEVQISGTPNETHWQGKVAGGGASLTVVTENGNIQIAEEGE